MQDWFNVPWFFKVATAFSFFSGPGTVHARRTRLLYGRRNRFEVSTKRSWISIRNVQLLIWGRLWENLGGLPLCARVSKEWPKTWKHFRKQILYRKVYFDFLWNAFLPTQKKLHPNNFFDYYYVPHHRIGERTIRYIKHFLYRCYMYL